MRTLKGYKIIITLGKTTKTVAGMSQNAIHLTTFTT